MSYLSPMLTAFAHEQGASEGGVIKRAFQSFAFVLVSKWTLFYVFAVLYNKSL